MLGRYPLLDACRLAEVSKGSALLVSAYHCRIMLGPVFRLELEVQFYPVQPDLSLDLTALDTCLKACLNPVKALLGIHYFGFPQNIQLLAEYRARNGVTLIADCSHVMSVKTGTNATPATGAMGRTNRFGIASRYKFFSSQEGGLLLANDGVALQVERQPGLSFRQALKGFVNSVQQTLASNHPPDLPTLDSENKALSDKRALTGRDEREQGNGFSAHYMAAEEPLQSLASSRWIMRHTDLGRLAARRAGITRHGQTPSLTCRIAGRVSPTCRLIASPVCLRC
jgi:hypothetical protein